MTRLAIYVNIGGDLYSKDLHLDLGGMRLLT